MRPRILSGRGVIARLIMTTTTTLVIAGPGRAAPLPSGAPPLQKAQVDSSHPTWKAVDVQLSRIAGAERNRDIDALRSIYAPDFISAQRNGEQWDVERALAFQANSLKLVEKTICLNPTIVRMEVDDNRAQTTVMWDWTRMQQMAGKVRRVQTSALYDETWVKGPGGWKRRAVENVRSCTALVDDKRVDVSRPYDPEAPAYDPRDPHPRQVLADALYPAFKERGAEAGLEQFHSLRGSQDYYTSESSLNALGYRLLSEKKPAEAVAVLKLNTELYPRSANAYDSLGEAFLAAGDKGQAARNYRRSLELNPKNDNARAALRKLGR